MQRALPYLGVFLLSVILFGGTFFFRSFTNNIITQKYGDREMRPVISTFTVQTQSLQPALTSTGSLISDQSVDVSSQVSGQVVDIFFASGERVEAGQVLVQLDNRIAQLTYDRDLALLANKKANLARQEKLFTSKATSEERRDQARVEFLTQEAVTARDLVTLENHTIKAPFSGKLGIRDLSIGQYITPQIALINLQHTDPIHFDFTLASRHLKSVYPGLTVLAKTEQFPDRTLKGVIKAIDASVDQSTRTFTVRCEISNPDSQLIAGQAARARVLLPQREGVLMVPRTAVTISLYGDTVFVVNPLDEQSDRFVVQQRTVKTGTVDGDFIEVLEGLDADEQIVVSGQNKIRTGVEILIQNED